MNAIVQNTENSPESVAELRDAINREAALLQQDQVSMLARAFNIGDWLNQAKEEGKRTGEIPFGEWEDWCDQNIKLEKSQRKVYAQVARETPKSRRAGLLESGATIRQAVRQLTDESREEATKRHWTVAEWRQLRDERKTRIIADRKAGSSVQFNRQEDSQEDQAGNIEWARWSWNPVTGCEHDCPYCYARDIANRFTDAYPQGFEPSIIPDRLAAPKNTRVPQKAENDIGHRNVFTCSMADLFGRWVPAEWIEAVLSEVRDNPQWNFLFLTKFPQRLTEFEFPVNAWVGTTVDMQARVKAAEDAFAKIKAGVKWVSVEPMVEPIQFTDLGRFDWLVMGGASRSSQTQEWRPPLEWMWALRQQAIDAGVQVYMKTNLLRRERYYPGSVERLPDVAPVELHSLGKRKLRKS